MGGHAPAEGEARALDLDEGRAAALVAEQGDDPVADSSGDVRDVGVGRWVDGGRKTLVDSTGRELGPAQGYFCLFRAGS